MHACAQAPSVADCTVMHVRCDAWGGGGGCCGCGLVCRPGVAGGGRGCRLGRGLRSDGLLKFLFLNLRCCQTITESLHAPGR